jgi:phage shock protein A
MDQRRLAAVFAWDRGEPPRTSTGYVIASRLLLTAAHAVESTGKIEAQLIDQADPMPCTVVWNGRAHELDAAVLEVDAQHWPSFVLGKPVRFGRLATLQPATPAETIGFPAAQRALDGELETAHVYGHINPGDGLVSGRWVLSVADTPPGDLGSSPWRGISGAPLFSGDLLCGVVVVDPPHWRHGKLDAVRVHRLLQNEEFHSLLRERLGYFPVAEAVELESLAEPVMLSRPPRSLPELLRPQAETVRFSGREGQVAEFLSWCNGGGVMARLLIGPGGQGKTRFARELGRVLAAQEWVVAQLRDSAGAESYKILGKIVPRLLLIMDYADTRPGSVAEVMRVFEEEGSRGTVRILLIARSAGEWWDQLPASASTYVSLLSGATVIKLDALAETVSARQTAYHEALLDLAHGLRRLPDYADTDWEAIARAFHAPDLSDARLGSPLTLQLRALTDLLAAQPGAQPSHSGRTVEALFLAHEERYWARTAGRRLPLRELDLDELGDAVAAATLTRASRKERAVELLANVPSLRGSPQRARALAAWLSDLYPASTESYWGALEPDRLGEYHVSIRIRKDPRFLQDFLTVLNTDEAVRALTVLARAGAQPISPCPDLLAQLSALIALHPEHLAVPAAYVATQSENPDFLIKALSSLATRSDLSADLLENLNTAFPPQTASLAEPALNIAESLIRANRKAVRRGRLIPSLSPRSHTVQPSLGDPNASAAQVSARIAARADLARAYHNYSHRLMGLGKWHEAIDAGEHAISLYRRLARRHPDPYREFLAGSLDNQAMALSSADRLGDALRASQQARTVHRALAADGSDSHLASLARSLSNVSGIFAGLGAYQAAINTSTEAVAILSQLADRKPRLYLAELASARHNQANHYARAFWVEEAEAASEGAVAIRRPLAVQRPDANLAGLAHSLHNFSIDLAAAKKEEAASAILDESISLYLRLVFDKGGSYLPDLANALNTKAIQCREEEELGNAIIAGARSVLFYMQVVRERPVEFQRDLAMALRNHRWALMEAGLVHPGKWDAVLKQADKLSQRGLRERPGRAKNRTLKEDEEIRKLGTEIAAVKELEDLRDETKEIPDRYKSATRTSEGIFSWLQRRLGSRDPRETLDYSYQLLLERLTLLQRSVADITSRRESLELELNAMRERETTEEGQELADLDSRHRMLLADEERLTEVTLRVRKKVDAFRAKGEVLKATYTAAEAGSRINDAISKISDELGSFGMAMRRAQDKTTYMQVRVATDNDLTVAARFDSVTGLPDEAIQANLDRIGGDIAAELEWLEGEISSSPPSAASASADKAHHVNAADEPQAGKDS